MIEGRSGLFESLDPAGSTEERLRASVTPISLLERVVPDVVPFVTGLAPLVEGERTAVALPFALTVR